MTLLEAIKVQQTAEVWQGKKLTEKQAWLKIARGFEMPGSMLPFSPLANAGLCKAVSHLKFNNYITEATALSMRKRIERETSGLKTYLFKITTAGARARAKLARKFAKEAK